MGAMPGHDLGPVGDVHPSLLCPECGLILKEAVQTCEGERFCKECFDAIAQYVNNFFCDCLRLCNVCTVEAEGG